MTSYIFDDKTLITSKNQLVEMFFKNQSNVQKIGIEDESFLFNISTLQRLSHDASNDQPSITSVLKALSAQFGWEPIFENEHWVGLNSPQGSSLGNISFEPGGQFEFASHPCDSLHALWQIFQQYLQHVKTIAKDQNIFLLKTGVDPVTSFQDIPWGPKKRYDIMRKYMPQKGSLGLWMMGQTCGTQVSLDFLDEKDMVRKFRLALRLQPFITALFANSSICEGKLNGYESYRSYIWSQTDPDRCGFLPFVLDGDMGFERYVDYALDVPMYFVYRQGVYHPASAKTFREYMANPACVSPEFQPQMSDWLLHLTTLFPEVRLKNVLEMRGADSCSPENAMALTSFWVSLFYHEETTKALEALVKHWHVEDLSRLYEAVPREGMAAKIHGKTLYDWSEHILPLIYQGLVQRDQGEDVFFEPLERMLETRHSPSKVQELLLKETGAMESVLAYFSL